MNMLNFAHPLTPAHLDQIKALSGKTIAVVKNISVHFDMARPYADQIVALVDGLGLTPQQWQNEPILINPPAMCAITAALLAELHGRMGYFAPCLRLRPIKDSLPPQFEVAEFPTPNKTRKNPRKRGETGKTPPPPGPCPGHNWRFK